MPHDDSLMSRFDEEGLRRFSARDAIAAVLVCMLLLVAFAGASVRRVGQGLTPGIGRTVVLAVGNPAGWVADHLPLAAIAHDATHWLSADTNLSSAGGGGFAALAPATGAGAVSGSGAVSGVTPDAFDPAALGQPPPAPRPLRTLLVTGDSMSQPLDQDLAQRLAAKGVRVVRDAHLGTGISTTFLLDWGREAAVQVRQNHPDAVVMFIGANDDFSMPGPNGSPVPCCSAQWAAIYANRARAMMNTYRQAGAARVYWLTLPAPRDATRQKISRVVNAAITVAAQPWASQIHVIDTVPIFTPGFVYRDAMAIGGQATIVRQPDGIHLNDAGANIAADAVLAAVGREFTTG
jgi:lysophospholipase L1-like esterase